MDTILVPNKRIQPCSIPDRNAKHTRVEIQVTIKTPLNVCLKKYPNVIPGISLPIHFKDSIIGVIGIGAGEQAATIGKVIQSTTELLIEQFHLKETLNAGEHPKVCVNLQTDVR